MGDFFFCIISVLLQDLFIFSSVSFSVSSLWCSSHLSGSAFVMSMRGRVTMGKLVGLAWATGSSSGVSDLTLSLSFSACRHDSGGSCRLPENLLWTIHSSTPRVLPEHRDASLLSWGYKEGQRVNNSENAKAALNRLVDAAVEERRCSKMKRKKNLSWAGSRK